jgi:hypothetical protein
MRPGWKGYKDWVILSQINLTLRIHRQQFVHNFPCTDLGHGAKSVKAGSTAPAAPRLSHDQPMNGESERRISLEAFIAEIIVNFK